jgi:hypothetical protein
MAGYLVPMLVGYGWRPLRMDYSFFLRASNGLLEVPPAEARPKEAALRLSKSQLRAFARFLGSRWLVTGYHWRGHVLILRLSPFKATLWKSLLAVFGNRASSLSLEENGSVDARLGVTDEEDLVALHGRALPEASDLENQVAVAVQSAWRHFREGNSTLAERGLGQVPDAEVFIVPTARLKSTLWLRVVFGGAIGLSSVLFGVVWLFPEWLSGQRAVSVTEAQVRLFLNDATPNPDPKKCKFNDPVSAQWDCLVLPPTNLFSPDGLRVMRSKVLLASGLTPQIREEWKTSLLCNSPLAKRAIGFGWIGWDDFNLKPQDVADFIHGNQKANELQFKLEFLLMPKKASSWVVKKGWDVKRTGDVTLTQLRWLRDVKCLDLVDRARLIQQIASVQVLSGTPPGQPPIHDWRDVRGLFFTPGWPALQDTYYSLAALEILGGLDRIDREQCVRGILRRHHGRGFFDSPFSGSYNEYHIAGSAEDTFAAFESLRILGALDRVKDLESWRFRLPSDLSSKPGANGARTLTWDEVEAWSCQQRLDRDLAEHRQNPAAPWRSLLEPSSR